MGTEGYSPRLVEKAVRQAAKAASFQEASDDMLSLAEVSISATHLQRLSERIGQEWVVERDREVQAFREDQLTCAYVAAPRTAAVMLDGGRVQTRADDSGRGVHDPAWRETKTACCLSLSSKDQATDPQPDPPSQFLDPERVARLTAEIKSRGRPSVNRQDRSTAEAQKPAKKTKKIRRRRRPASKQRVRTVIASMANSETFGWHVATEVKRRGLDRARQQSNNRIANCSRLDCDKWLLASLKQAAKKQRFRTVPARNLASLRKEISKAKARFGLPNDAPVRISYEAGRDGFWLYRTLTNLDVHNVNMAAARHSLDIHSPGSPIRINAAQ